MSPSSGPTIESPIPSDSTGGSSGFIQVETVVPAIHARTLWLDLASGLRAQAVILVDLVGDHEAISIDVPDELIQVVEEDGLLVLSAMPDVPVRIGAAIRGSVVDLILAGTAPGTGPSRIVVTVGGLTRFG